MFSQIAVSSEREFRPAFIFQRHLIYLVNFIEYICISLSDLHIRTKAEASRKYNKDLLLVYYLLRSVQENMLTR